MDKSIEVQQHVASHPFAVIAPRARSNDIADLETLVVEVLTVLPWVVAASLFESPQPLANGR